MVSSACLASVLNAVSRYDMASADPDLLPAPRPQVAHLKAQNGELKAAEQELVQASRQLEELQAQLAADSDRVSGLGENEFHGVAGEEVRRLREESKEAIDRIRRENEELVHALGGMRRQRDDALEVAQVSPCARVPRIHSLHGRIVSCMRVSIPS